MSQPMTFGLVGRLWGGEIPAPGEEYALAELADSLGYHAFWLNEEHFQRSPRMGTCPVVVGAGIAARTRRIRIGTAVILLPLHHPLHVAEQLATLDVLSHGRVDAGVSRGGQQYATAFGMDPSERFARFEEALDILRTAWTGETVGYDGEYYQFASVAVQPRPLQQEDPPLFVATYDLASVEHFARRGFRALEGGVEPPAAVHAKVLAFERGWAEGRPGSAIPPVPVTRLVHVGRTDDEARALAVPALRTAWEGMKRGATPQQGSDGDGGFDAFVDSIAIVGSAATVTRRMEELRDRYGINYVNLLVHSFWYLPAEAVTESVDRFGREVMPALV